jgi:hypothetical protein
MPSEHELTLSGWLESSPSASLSFFAKGGSVGVGELGAASGDDFRLASKLLLVLERGGVDFTGDSEDLSPCLCLENMAWIPSLRFVMGSMKEGDSVPTLPTSFGT